MRHRVEYQDLHARNWYSIAEHPATEPHLAHPEVCAALRIELVTVPRVSRSCEHFLGAHKTSTPTKTEARAAKLGYASRDFRVLWNAPPPKDSSASLGLTGYSRDDMQALQYTFVNFGVKKSSGSHHGQHWGSLI